MRWMLIVFSLLACLGLGKAVPGEGKKPVAKSVGREVEFALLAKEPARRYASALELAEDLARFSAGEPILARREAISRKLWRKMRRNLVVSVSLLTVVLAMTVAGMIAWRSFT